MTAKTVIQMNEKTTRLQKPENTITLNRDNFHEFTFDYSYWSYHDGDNNKNIVSQEDVYNDLGVDLLNCAFQGK